MAVTLEVSKYYEDKCKEFALKQLKTSENLYKRRGELSSNKIITDITVGKKGELAVYQYLKDREYALEKPDFAIYENRKKSFDADLTFGQYKIHVKTQSEQSMNRYGRSWLLQKSDPMLKDPSKYEYLAFVVMKDNVAEILGIVKVEDIINCGLLDECVVPRYRHTKHALYWENIKEVLINHRRWRL